MNRLIAIGEAAEALSVSHRRKLWLGANQWGVLPFDIILADKKSNSCGLQLTDLIECNSIKDIQNDRIREEV